MTKSKMKKESEYVTRKSRSSRFLHTRQSADNSSGEEMIISLLALKCSLLCSPLEPRTDNFYGCICKYEQGYVIPEEKNNIQKLRNLNHKWQERRSRKD